MILPEITTVVNDFSSISITHSTLLLWFEENSRDLPWRRTRNPYHILVSEIMLQQTQVDRVLPKYLAFLEQFPTIEDLAKAPTGDVIRAWAGLGYNRRAVNLQRAARTVLEEHSGVFPRDVAALRALPGIGPYTAGAVACFAFEQDVAFMDTNIRRVIQRLFVGPEEQGIAGEARLLQIAERAVPVGQGWVWNQAIMELGALICTASSPSCWRCPLHRECRAYNTRRVTDEQMFDGELTVKPQTRPRRVAERREAPFTGSNRFYRGRIVDALRNATANDGLSLDELGRRIKDEYDQSDSEWLLTLVNALAKDGLITFDGLAVRLPA